MICKVREDSRSIRPRLPRFAVREMVVVEMPRYQEDIFIQRMREADGARQLLLEILRRAAYDWVLYRTSRVAEKKQLAEEAFIWMFKEQPGHSHWSQRIDEDKEFTSFLSICEVLDMDPETVRNYIRTLTPHRITTAGRSVEMPQTETDKSVACHANVDQNDTIDIGSLMNGLLSQE